MFAPDGYKMSNQDHEKRYVQAIAHWGVFHTILTFQNNTRSYVQVVYERNPKAFLCWTSLEGAPTLSNQDHEERYVCTMPYNLGLEQLLIFTRHNLKRTWWIKNCIKLNLSKLNNEERYDCKLPCNSGFEQFLIFSSPCNNLWQIWWIESSSTNIKFMECFFSLSLCCRIVGT